MTILETMGWFLACVATTISKQKEKPTLEGLKSLKMAMKSLKPIIFGFFGYFWVFIFQGINHD